MQSYSLDLRKKVINFISHGNTQRSATKIFDLNKSTINRWWARYQKEGHISPRKNLGAKPKIDKTKLIEYVNEHPNSRLVDISYIFKISTTAIFHYLKKLGFSYKKNLFLYGSR